MKKLNLLIWAKQSIRNITLLMFLLSISKSILAQQITSPVYYWTFEGANPLKDSMNTSNLNTTTYNCIYSIEPNSALSVGNSLKLDTVSRAIVAAPNLALNTNVAIEFLFKPAPEFNTTTFIRRRDNAFAVKFGYPYIQFITTTSAGTDNFQVNLRGIGRATYGYYTDGNYHHMVFKYNAATGVKQIWVDGQLPEGFSDTTAAGTFATVISPVDINANTSYIKYFGNIDEIALYNQDLPANNIYRHYVDFTQQKHYSFHNSSVPPPQVASVNGPVDINEYAPGHPNYTISAVEQLQSFPIPRYKKGHTLMRNFNWLGLPFFSGASQPGVTTAIKVANSVSIQKELVKNYNYYLTVSCNTGSDWNDYNDPTTLTGSWIQLANQNPQWPTSAISFWPQLNPKSAGYASSIGYIENKSMPNNYYLRNSSGQFIDREGNLTSTHKTICPSAPLDSFKLDGLTQRFYLSKLLNALSRPLTFLNENDEVIPHLTTAAMMKDPAVVTDKLASGIASWEDYIANRKKRMCSHYRDQFMSLPGLQNTHYSEYQIGGNKGYMSYNEIRTINTPINGQIYATPDFYPRWPSNWRNWSAAWNGWQAIADGRVNELAQGDKLFSPFIAAGWSDDEESNIRPAQWLGLLKVIGMSGAEFYYTGFFNEGRNYSPTNPAANPAGYAWQAVVPSYAQAVSSRYENLLRSGNLLAGDVPNSYTNPTAPGYSFDTGDLRKLVVIRKHQSQSIYAITGTIQPNSNMLGNTEFESEARIKLNGSVLQFDVRRQGSTYIYDNTNPSAPVFYQLDGWHESSHPSRWTKDFNIETELYDNTTTTFKIRTDRAPGAAVTDFRNAMSYISFSGVTGTATAEYYIQPRTAGNYYFWVRARSRSGVSASIAVTLDSVSRNIGCITDTAWKWYSLDACSNQAISYSNLSAGEHKLILTASGTGIEIDKVLMTINGSLNLNPNQPVCSGASATVNASGSLSFCQGGSVALTANGPGSYIWSNGATTQTINVNTTGNYSVTIIGGTCNAASTPVAVTVKSLPSAIILPVGSTTICANDSVRLVASQNSSYLWSNGATTQAINVLTAGNYSVTVTGLNGCSKTSAAQAVTVNQLPTATIASGGPVSFCDGGSVTLTASNAASYLWSNGATTQGVNISASGNYIVTVTTANGCSKTSAAQAVTVNQLPTVTIASGGPVSFCDGGSVTLTASTAASYLWSNGATTQGVNISASGNYIVTVTTANGCSKTSAAQAVTVNQLPTATITSGGPLSFCDGGSVTLTASNAVSYLWSNGATTQSVIADSDNLYSVTVTNTGECSATSSTLQVTVFPAATATITANGSTQLTPGQSVVLTANSGSSYLWSPNGETTSSVTVTQAGDYSVTVYDANGCSATSSIINVSVVVALSATITNNGSSAICEGDSVILSAPANMNSYAWLPNGETTQTITVKQGNTYQVTISDASGNTASDNVTIAVNPLPLAPTISIAYMPNVAYQLTANEPSATAYLWSNGETTATITIFTPDNYTVQATSGFGCVSAPASMDITSIMGQQCAAPDMLTNYNVQDTAATFAWNPGITGDSFLITYWMAGGLSFKTATVAGNISSKLITGLLPGTEYIWKVQSNCLNSQQVSANASFTTQSNILPCGSTPQNTSVSSINTKIVNLNWYPTVATTFKVRFRRVGVTGYSTKIYDGLSNVSGGVLKNLAPSTTYEWSIQSICNGVTSPFSPSAFFTTLDTCGYMGVLDANSITHCTAILEWENLASMDTVRIRITNVATTVQRSIYLRSNPVNGTYQVGSLNPNTTYSVEVRGKCSTGQLGSWSNKVTFTTENLTLRTEAQNPLGLNGFPNPASTILNYTFADDKSSDYTLKVCDMAGREMYQEVRYAEKGPNAGELDVTRYPTGLYMLIMQKGAQSCRFRFTVH